MQRLAQPRCLPVARRGAMLVRAMSQPTAQTDTIRPPLTDRIALITGASGGIGRAIARRLASAGARLVLHFHSNRGAAEELRADLSGSQPAGRAEHVLIGADLRDPEATRGMVDAVLEQVPGVDILVNNAGLYERYPLMDTPFETWLDGWHRAVATNLTAPAQLSYLLARHMAERGGGRMINIGSRGAFRGEPDAPGYGAAKAGLHALTQSLAVALAPRGIFVFAVAPGFVETAMARPYMTGELANALRQQSPLGRVAKADDVAYWVECMARPEASFATGTIVDVNGASYLRT